MILDPAFDLTKIAGQRVVVDSVRVVRITAIRHCGDSDLDALRGGVGGSCVEEPHGDCRGGSTAFWWPYGTDVALAEECAA